MIVEDLIAIACLFAIVGGPAEIAGVLEFVEIDTNLKAVVIDIGLKVWYFLFGIVVIQLVIESTLLHFGMDDINFPQLRNSWFQIEVEGHRLSCSILVLDIFALQIDRGSLRIGKLLQSL